MRQQADESEAGKAGSQARRRRVTGEGPEEVMRNTTAESSESNIKRMHGGVDSVASRGSVCCGMEGVWFGLVCTFTDACFLCRVVFQESLVESVRLTDGGFRFCWGRGGRVTCYLCKECV